MAETPSVAEQERYIRQAAIQRGIDPNVAVRVARSEGLAQGVWQSNSKKGSIREPSYGPFQLLVGGPGTGFPKGLGNAFMRATGLDPRSKSSVFAQIDFALNAAVQQGWGAWYGAKKVGVDRWTGLRGAQPAPINREAVQIASLPADAPIPTPRAPQFAENAPIPPIRPSAAPAPVMTASAPIPERFGGRGSGTAPPVMAGFAPDPARFGRVPTAPPAPATGGRVGSGSFSAPPDPARFGPPPSAPSPAFRMAPPDVPDPARLGQIAMGPPGMMAARQATWGPGGMSIPAFPTSALPSNPGELGGIRMSNPVGLGGPGGLHMPPPQAAPVQPQVQPAAPQLPPPVTVQDYPVAEVGAPPMVPQAPRPTSGNTVETDQFGNRSVTNKFGATTISGPGGNQSAGSLPNSSATNPSAYAAANSAINSAINSAGIPQIPGPLGNPFSGILGEGQPQGFGKTLGGGLLGARMGMMGGLPGMAVGGILGSLLGRELSKPGGGRLAPLASALGIGQQRFATGFPAAPAAPPRSFQPMTEAQHRDFLNSPGIRESAQAQSALSRGGGGLY
jgi:hypothetical protein